MRTSPATAFAWAAFLAAVGCAVNPAPVPMVADPEGKRLLAGDWVGEHYSDAGREGSISFSLVPHDTTQCGGQGEHAHGDVLMVPRGATRALEPVFDEGSGEDPLTSQVLTIELLRVAGNEVTGTLTPYRDPQTGVLLSTTFQGRIVGDTIKGTMVTVNGRTGEQFYGRWDVVRKE